VENVSLDNRTFVRRPHCQDGGDCVSLSWLVSRRPSRHVTCMPGHTSTISSAGHIGLARSLAVTGLRIVTLIGLVVAPASAYAGPCTTLIAEVERYVERLTSVPSAKQTIGAQLHHQPTPQSVEQGLNEARANAEAALDRARKADADGDVAACTKAVDEVKLIYGLE
jgi:hypothetical protein